VKDDSERRLLERVIKDETEHRHEFSELLEKVRASGQEEPDRREPADRETVELIRELIKDEYRIILSYLHSFFRSKDWEYSMVHMGELGEKLGDMGAVPDLSLPAVEKGSRLEEYILDEKNAGEEYLKGIGKVSDPELIRLLNWIKVHEEYHRHRLEEFLQRTKRFTVGDLK